MMERVHGVAATYCTTSQSATWRAPHSPGLATLNAVMTEKQTLFIADTFVNESPDAELIANIALMAANEVRRFGVPPKVAFLSHSNYGSSRRARA